MEDMQGLEKQVQGMNVATKWVDPSFFSTFAEPAGGRFDLKPTPSPKTGSICFQPMAAKEMYSKDSQS